MKIAIDLQGIQSKGSRSRGIGRYSLEIVRNIIDKSKNHDIYLVSNPVLQDVTFEFSKELDLKNVFHFEWFSPCPLAYLSKNITYDIAKILRSYFFSCLQADIILLTSYMEGFADNCSTDFDKDLLSTPITSIFYDLIPLINPSLYFRDNHDFKRFYKSKINNLNHFDGLLAISESSRSEAIKYLEFDSTNVYNISAACDKSIFNQNVQLNEINKLNYLNKFLLYTGASDPRKNLKGLLKAYSLLPEDLKKYKLVLAGKLLNSEEELIKNWINIFEINEQDVVILGYVSDQELVYLYRNCSLYIFPSFHEGFGLPVLEAMSCGAPVIASNTTSIPEIICMNDAMFDPDNVLSIKRLIQKSLTNEKFMDQLLQNSHLQKNKFSWSKSAECALKALEAIILKNSKRLDLISLENRSELTNKYLKKLSNKIKSSKFRFNEQNTNLFIQIASSMDLMNIQIDNLLRMNTTSHKVKSWKVEGPFDSNYSLAILNRSFAVALNNCLDNVSINVTEGLGDYSVDIDFMKKDLSLYTLFSKSNSYQFINTDVVSRNMFPPRVSDLNSRYNLIHAYGWEEAVFPHEWVCELNSYLQGITVMSSQVKKILIDNGVSIPIEVCGLGLDHLGSVIPSKDFYINSKDFKFLHISSCFPRKGIDVLLEAYSNSFTSDDNVSLIIKTFENKHNYIDSILDKMRKDNPSFPEVILLKDDISDEDLKSLYLQSNVLVSPSRGEGFGLPIAEAMLLGLPVITTGWGGQTDFCKNDNSWLIDYSFTQAKSHFDLDLSHWAEPSISHLSSLLLYLYEQSSSSELLLKIENAKASVKTFTWESVANKNLHFVNNRVNTFEIKPFKVGWVSTWNTRCGIASYSKHLLDYFNDEVIVFNPFSEYKVCELAHTVVPSWNFPATENASLDDLFTNILKYKITTLVIQFNFSFFEYPYFNDFILKLKNNNIKIIIFIHSTIDPLNDQSKRLINLVDSLKLCDRLLVHTIDDLNRMKNINLINNVSLFPHGILDYKSKSIKSRKESKFLIASYGFCLPNKGFKELIYAIKLLQKYQLNIEVNIFSAIYNDNYMWVYEELKDLVVQLNLGGMVNIHPEYQTDDETLNSLASHDIIVFPYQSSTESSSAAVRHGLATLKPVIVTPLPIFNDVSNLVSHFSDITPKSISEGLYQFIQNNNRPINSKKINLIKNRSFQKLSFRLFSMISSLEENQSSNS